ncbi:Galactose-binding protein [Raphanus sativus]|nr:Galactose-binding protein [Raphanus sativus]
MSILNTKVLTVNGSGVPSPLANATHYRLGPDGTVCRDRTRAEETLVDTVRIANLEHYSSNLKDFSLSGSPSYPTELCSPFGSFVAANVKQVQTFRLPAVLSNLASHYGSEFYCTLSVVEVFGIDALEQMVEDLFVGSETLPRTPAVMELDLEVDEKQYRFV